MAKGPKSSYVSASRSLLKWARGLILRNLGFKILSLAIAILLWGMVREEQDLEEMVDVYLRLERPDDMILLEQVPQYVTVRVNGPRSRLRLAEQQKLEMVLDLNGVTAGETTVNTASLKIRNLPNDLRVAAYYPSALTLSVDHKAEKEVKLIPQIAGNPAKDFLFSKATIDPSTIILEGARAHLAEVEEVSTQIIDISGINRNQERSVDLDYGDYYIWPQSKLMAVQVKVEVKPDIIEGEVIDIPILPHENIEAEAGDFTFEPRTAGLKIKGPRSQVQGLRKEHIRLRFQPGSGDLSTQKSPIKARWEPEPKGVNTPHISAVVAPPKYRDVEILGFEPRLILVELPEPSPTPAPSQSPEE